MKNCIQIYHTDKKQVVISNNKTDERGGASVKVVFPHLTVGELLALMNALEEYKTMVGKDVNAYFTNGYCQYARDNGLQDIK